MERKDPKEKKCAICGKDIYAGEEWAYKIRPQKGRTLFFCKYSHKRQYEKEHPEKKVDVIAQAAAEEEKKPKKVPTERGCIARSLIDVIRHGGNPIEFMREQGYKNPYEAYSSVRHYCETNEPHLAEVLKPLRELQKAPAKTGRPEKAATVEKVEEVPPVQCIQHVAPTDLEEAEEAVADLILQGGVNYQLKVDEATKPAIETKKPGFRYEIKTIETSIGEFSYDRKAHLLIFRRKDEENEFGHQYLSMSTAEWDKLLIIVPQLADLMGVTL